MEIRPEFPPEGATNAIRHIGTNAVPLLLKWIKSEDDMPGWRWRCYKTAYRLSVKFPSFRSAVEVLRRPFRRPERAVWGFEVLGESASGAVSDLVGVARGGNRRNAEYAVIALGALGKDALPPLFSFASDRTYSLRGVAIASLGGMHYLGTNGHPVVIFLVRSLEDPDVQEVAAYALGKLELESEISVAALVRCIRPENGVVLDTATEALEHFGADSRQAVPQLKKCLEDRDFLVRARAESALRRIAPEVLEEMHKEKAETLKN